MRYRLSVNRASLIAIVAMIVTGLAGCKPTTPSQYIQPDEIEDILVEYHIARAIAQQNINFDGQKYDQALYWNSILKKHGITQADFDSSMVFYYTHADRFDKIYNRVTARLEDNAMMLGATEGEIGKYATLNTSGDTANIWTGSSSQVMMTMSPYNRYEFSVAVDSLFKEGDTFLMQFMSDFVYQSGGKDGFLYVAVEYPDTVVTKFTSFSYSGLCQLSINSKVKSRPKAVKGYFHLGGAFDPSTTLRLLLIDNIQLIRFHKKSEEPKPGEADSSSPDSLTQRQFVAAGGSGVFEEQSVESLPSTRGNRPHRVVERIDSVKARK